MGRSVKGVPPRFDGQGVKLEVGVVLLCLAMGLLLGWGVLTAPEGSGPTTQGYTTAQRLARLLPADLQERLALILAALFVLFGGVLFLAGVWGLLKHLWARGRG